MSFVLIGNCINAQATLNIDEQIPSIGEQYDVLYIDATNLNFSPGPAGENQLWDFSQIDVSTALNLHFSILAPEEGVGAADYPDADFIWLLYEFGAYNYYAIKDNNIELIGGVFGAFINGEEEIDFQQVFTDSDDALQYPATYNSMYDFNSTADQKLGGMVLRRCAVSVSFSQKASAWG